MIHKKKKEEGKFRLFWPYSRPISAFFGHIDRWLILPNMPDTAWFWPNQPGSAWIEVDSARIELHRRESSRVGVNLRKKKKQIRTDAQAIVLDAASRIAPRWTQVPRLCFLETKYHSYLSKKKKKKLSLQVYIKNRWKLNAIISLKKARKLCSFQIEIILRHTNHLLITKIVHIFQKTITLFQTIQRGREIERTHAHKRK